MCTTASRATALALLVMLGGCVEVERPGGPTGPEANDPLDGPPVLRISQPSNGQIVLRTAFTQEPGVRLLIDGSFLPDHRIVVEAYQNNHPLPFSTQQFRIESGQAAQREFFLLGSEQHLITATAATVHLRLRQLDGRDISADSVVLAVR